jgi:hypothetical protein
MACTSCYPSTQYEWLTRYSGRSEDDIVYAAVELACTVCYPTAPVQVPARVVGDPSPHRRGNANSEPPRRRTGR